MRFGDNAAFHCFGSAIRASRPLPLKARFWAFSPIRCTSTTWSCAAAGFPPEQVLSCATGLDRADFTTHQARRILTRLGFVAARAHRRGGVTGAGERQEPGGGGQADSLRPYVGQVGRARRGRPRSSSQQTARRRSSRGWRATDAGRPTGCSGFRPRSPSPKALRPHEVRVPGVAWRWRGNPRAPGAAGPGRGSRGSPATLRPSTRGRPLTASVSGSPRQRAST